ncbi:hypothetical protein BH23ACI1_BH23ACI1_19350 [soil metagenome]
MRAMIDLVSYTRILPYDSEIFGVYQPLLGWRSKQVKERIAKGFKNDLADVLKAVGRRLTPDVKLEINADRMIEGARIAAASTDRRQAKEGSTFIYDIIAEKLPPIDDYEPEVWDELLAPATLEAMLNREAVQRAFEWQHEAFNARASRSMTDINQMLADQLNRESLAAGYLLELKVAGNVEALKEIFYALDPKLMFLEKLRGFRNPLDYFDPFKDIDRVSLSPIGIVHLYRQYFFEFDTFLGSPVGHVWLSPGSTVELIEVNTRKTLVERSLETELETTIRSEKSTTDEDELSSAVKEDNKSDTKFGMNATVNQGWIGGSASATSSFDMGSTQAKARETSHRHMRQQAEKLSTEIRKNHKSTFRTVTETTDTSSKRYVLANSTDKLINYELRRKMRQVGVQVQDIGTYLCWQTYVDDPGRQLGISRLVHIAKDPEVGQIPPPESVTVPEPTESTIEIDIPFVQASSDRGDLDEAYAYGTEVDTDLNEGEKERIQYKFGPYEALSPLSGFVYQNARWDYLGNDVRIELDGLDVSVAGKISFGIKLAHVNFRGVSPIRVALKVGWKPSDAMIGSINSANAASVANHKAAEQREFQKAFVAGAAERVKLASSIHRRPFEDLREEERIVVYRSLIQAMLTKGISQPDDRTRHVVSELLNTIFDIDKMLYFVAPEWWRPRLHRSHQALGIPKTGAGASSGGSGAVSGSAAAKKAMTVHSEAVLKNVQPYAHTVKLAEDSQVPATSTVSWGGVGEGRGDNYYITGDSEPARLGSSLGWLMQLDGDNMRNAFLNAPWVKAVIPIRPGQEQAAINWLSRVHVEGTDGLDDEYVAPADQLAKIPHSGPKVTIRDAIDHLCKLVAEKHKGSFEVSTFPTEEINDDNTVRATPLDKVYEHGFYPLQGGFRLTPDKPFEVFDQWIEILPTDQVVPVEVKYDPKTGRQI